MSEVAEVGLQVVELSQVVSQLEVVDHSVQLLQIVTHQFEVEVLIQEAVVPLKAREKGFQDLQNMVMEGSHILDRTCMANIVHI